MLDKLKDMKDLMKKAKDMKSEMKKIQNELKDLKIVGKDKQDKIKIALTGELECVAIQIEPELLLPENKDDLEKRLAYAFNQAAQKAKTLATNKLSSVSQGLNIPGL